MISDISIEIFLGWISVLNYPGTASSSYLRGAVEARAASTVHKTYLNTVKPLFKNQ